jgi:hypothetical protein
LADAMLSLLGPRAGSSSDAAVDGSAGVGDAAHGGDSGEAREAVFRFAHALMKDLKQLGGERAGEGAAMRHGWGHRDWSDLQQRVQGLASAVQAQVLKAPVRAAAGAPAAQAQVAGPVAQMAVAATQVTTPAVQGAVPAAQGAVPAAQVPVAAAQAMVPAAQDAAVVAEPAAGAAVDAGAPKLPGPAPAVAQSPSVDADPPVPAAPGAPAPAASVAIPARASVSAQALPAAAAQAAVQASAEERAVQAQANGVKDLPQPVTPISAAVHLMQVPSSQLLAAFSALRAAVPQAELWKTEGGELDELGDFLQRLSATLEPSVDAPPRAGWLLHETA